MIFNDSGCIHDPQTVLTLDFGLIGNWSATGTVANNLNRAPSYLKSHAFRYEKSEKLL